ncbi:MULTISPECIES: hypothetical protein [Vibrio]|jgi:isocitrate dehydrogenase kinase/phosphatase|uniref:Uncharacterized protein n=1 Tax=Vibrio kanaloae TaxID=170673 RepID=A0A4U1XWA7_9VIBR|nr:hypothetical protein [Vibrio kanaloae]KAB0461989.1 hypothetical protein F7Q89_15725 [Vibrio kanaloae]MCG9559884.1 hypothetical protein [Vibrio kanaloae]NOI00930.1 hypothetical protein [Vibrio kanaloae]OEF15558.1 hypothetical protein A132_17025 [Vibrio kanaloae 5S-149]QPK06455.1 hypothetical protein BTD91_14915 [Vibrio kanaloae]
MDLKQGHIMNTQQFEAFKQQIQHLNPQQLKALQGEIDGNLETEKQTLLTDEELNVLNDLFS